MLMQIQKSFFFIFVLFIFILFILAIVVIIYVLFILADIYRRDPNDFDKINYNPPPGVDNLVIDPKTGKAVSTTTGLINPVTGKPYDTSTSASTSKNTLVSSGQDACFKDQSYDYYSGKCIPKCSTNDNYYRDMTSSFLMDNNKLDYTKATGDVACQDPVTAAPSGTKVCGKFYIPKDYSCGATEGFANYSPTEFSVYASLHN